MRSYIHVVCLLIFAGSVALAGEVSGDRPDFTDSPLVVPKGAVQLEAGYTYADVGDGHLQDLGEILLRIGLIEPLELRVGLGGYQWADGPGGDRSGWADGSLGVKWTLRRGEGLGSTDIGVILGTSVPYGGEDVGVDGWQPGGTLALGWQLSQTLSLATNVGYSYAGSPARRFDQGFASLSLGIEASERVGLFVEGYAFNKESVGGSTSGLVNAGAVFEVSDNLLLDVRIGAGFGDSDTDYLLGIGIVRRW